MGSASTGPGETIAGPFAGGAGSGSTNTEPSWAKAHAPIDIDEQTKNVTKILVRSMFDSYVNKTLKYTVPVDPTEQLNSTLFAPRMTVAGIR
jgi:hypothetical protein